MSIEVTIFLGVISGILTALLLFVVGVLVNRSFLPWYRSLIYSGIDVSGVWKHEINVRSNRTQISTFKIKPNAHSIKGKASVSKYDEKQNLLSTEDFYVKGKIKDRLVHITLEPTDKKRLGIITYLVEVVGSGNIMKGWSTWYSIINEELLSVKATIERPERR